MKLFSAFLFILTALVFAQCRSGRTITKAIAPRDTSVVIAVKTQADSILLNNAVKAALDSKHINFKTFSAKLKLEIEDSKGKKPELSANVRIIKDSAIWISISATILNVEVFRAYITKDSVTLLNKQEHTVQYRSLDYLQEITDIPFDFKTLQNLLVGNPIFFNDSSITTRKTEGYLLVSSLGAEFKNLLTISLPDSLLLHSKLDDADITRNRTADFTYDEYANANGVWFSSYREIVASEKNKLDVRMNFKQFEFNKELSLNFNVPKNYKKD